MASSDAALTSLKTCGDPFFDSYRFCYSARFARHRSRLIASASRFASNSACRIERSFGPSDCWGSRPVMGACRACTVLSKAWETFDRSGAYDSDAGRWLRFCDSLGTSTLPGRTSQSCLPLVLWPFNLRQGSGPFRVLACTQRAVPQHRRLPHRVRACRGSVH